MSYAQTGYTLVLHQDANPRTGGVAICGFSTVGMVGVIATSHIINKLNLKQLGTVMNAEFPALALIHDEVPKHPVRVYQGQKIGVFTSEVQFNSKHDVQFANTVLEWFTKGGFDRLIIIDGLVKPDKKGEQGDLFGVGSISTAREMLTKAGVEPIQQGVVAGICGYLLSEGERLGLDITAILAECSPMYPDARAAALAIEAVSELIGIEIPLSSLIEDARAIENSVQEIFENAQNALPAPEDTSSDPSFG